MRKSYSKELNEKLKSLQEKFAEADKKAEDARINGDPFLGNSAYDLFMAFHSGTQELFQNYNNSLQGTIGGAWLTIMDRYVLYCIYDIQYRGITKDLDSAKLNARSMASIDWIAAESSLKDSIRYIKEGISFMEDNREPLQSAFDNYNKHLNQFNYYLKTKQRELIEVTAYKKVGDGKNIEAVDIFEEVIDLNKEIDKFIEGNQHILRSNLRIHKGNSALAYYKRAMCFIQQFSTVAPAGIETDLRILRTSLEAKEHIQEAVEFNPESSNFMRVEKIVNEEIADYLSRNKSHWKIYVTKFPKHEGLSNMLTSIDHQHFKNVTREILSPTTNVNGSDKKMQEIDPLLREELINLVTDIQLPSVFEKMNKLSMSENLKDAYTLIKKEYLAGGLKGIDQINLIERLRSLISEL
ncbi:MAG: hypothetical protein QM768_12090 [Agriterribacter sp.]